MSREKPKQRAEYYERCAWCRATVPVFAKHMRSDYVLCSSCEKALGKMEPPHTKPPSTA